MTNDLNYDFEAISFEHYRKNVEQIRVTYETFFCLFSRLMNVHFFFKFDSLI